MSDESYVDALIDNRATLESRAERVLANEVRRLRELAMPEEADQHIDHLRDCVCEEQEDFDALTELSRIIKQQHVEVSRLRTAFDNVSEALFASNRNLAIIGKLISEMPSTHGYSRDGEILIQVITLERVRDVFLGVDDDQPATLAAEVRRLLDVINRALDCLEQAGPDQDEFGGPGPVSSAERILRGEP